MVELRRDFGSWIRQHYPRWVRGQEDGPLLSVDVVRSLLLPLLGANPVFFVVLDCMRLDQWRVIAPLLAPHFEIEEKLHYSILPTATPYARNALFSGKYPHQIARERPGWWNHSDDEGSLNAFEDELLTTQLKYLTGRGVPVHDERHLFEMLILEGAQAGLSWLTILRKREAYRSAFAGFDPERIARYGEEKIAA